MARITEHTGGDVFRNNDALIRTLAAHKIYTVIDFLQTDLEKIVTITNLSYKNVSAIRKYMLMKHSAPLISGVDYYENYIKNTAIIPTGILSLDNMLDSGMLTGNILEICGFSCSGKTQFCHTVTVHVAHDLRMQVLYVDAKKDFSAGRIKSIIKEKGCEDKMVDVLQNIKVYEPADIYDCLTILHTLSKDIDNHLRLVIIDSMPALFLPFQGEKKLSNCLLNNIVNVVKYIATKHHVAFVTTNMATRWIESENMGEAFDPNSSKQLLSPALGKYWLTVPSTRLLFQTDEDDREKIHASIMKSTNHGIDLKCTMQITAKGLC